ncbi:hypothetical protein BDW02DRAFT_564559 [Decorospora gaudefroyi]|uniref:RNA-binding La domain-containing protein n=1 Tax=Decorospora gaudefroyi TaxID=184978 RepID=A0A6A5KS02_9PLEO|nr:hypothetical protein BDW02DRAFT_564559 [Decorospora gaudefroyi]
MADTEKTAAAATSPAAVTETQSAGEVGSGAKAETAEATTDSKPAEKASRADDGEEKWALNGKSDEKNGRRNDRGDRHDRYVRDNQRRDGARGRGQGRGSFHGKANGHSRTNKQNREFDNLPETDDPNEIRAQMEFYFSAQNLATDKHMFEVLEGPKNKPVPIHHICTFKRMRRFKPYSAVVAALRDSEDLVVVDDGEYNKPGSEAIKRKEPLVVPSNDGDEQKSPTTEELFYRLKNGSSNNMETSVYVKGFGKEEDAGQIALEKFFRPYGAVMVRKRRADDNAWKGSVFVEFDNEESQKQFLALDPTPQFNGNELVTMGKKEYILMKCKEKGIKPDWELTPQEKYEQRKKQREANGDNHGRSWGGGSRGNRGQSRGGRGGRGGYDRRDNRRDRNRSRSPRRRRDHSASGDSVDSRDWNERRNRFKSGKDDRGSRKEEKKEIDRDAHGVPVVKDSRTEAEIAANSNKRKADDGEREGSPKKSKIEIKQDE